MTYDNLVNQLKEVKDGKRGWVSLTKKLAKEVGTTQDQLFIIVQVLGLELEQHGKYGYTAHKAR